MGVQINCCFNDLIQQRLFCNILILDTHKYMLTTEFEEQFNHWWVQCIIVRQVCEDKAYQRIPSINANRRLLG